MNKYSIFRSIILRTDASGEFHYISKSPHPRGSWTKLRGINTDNIEERPVPLLYLTLTGVRPL